MPPEVRPNEIKDEFVVPVQRIRKWIGEETKLILLVPAIQGYNNFKNR